MAARLEITEAEARQVLAPHEDALHRIVVGAWRDLHRWLDCDTLNEHGRLELGRPAPYANNMAALMYGRVRQEAAEAAGLRVWEQHHKAMLVVAERVLLRFKKVDADGLSRNYPTRQAQLFNAQMELDGLPKIARVDVGYLLAEDGKSVDVLVVHRVKNLVAWKYGLSDSGESVERAQWTPELVPPLPPRGTGRTSRVGKREQQEESHEGQREGGNAARSAGDGGKDRGPR